MLAKYHVIFLFDEAHLYFLSVPRRAAVERNGTPFAISCKGEKERKKKLLIRPVTS